MRILILLFAGILLSNVNMAQYRVSGTIYDENGDGIPGQIIQLLPTDKNVISDIDGQFVFNDVKQGVYTLTTASEWWQSTKELQIGSDLTDVNLYSNLVMPVDEVVIKSIRFGEEHAPGRSNMNKKEIAKQLGVTDMPYILRFTPATVVTSDAGAGVGYTGMRIRGSDQTRINVTINGIPLNDAESQNVFFVDLPDLAGSANNIQVQRGVGTSTNGAASFGASVNINTHTYEEKPSMRISGMFGSFNTKKAALQFNTGKIGDGFYLSGRVSQITSDGYIDRAESDLKSIALSPTYIFGSSSIRYDLLYGKERTYQAWYGIGPDLLETDRTYNPAGTERPGSPYPDQVDDYLQVHHQLHFNTALSDDIRLGVSGHYTPGNGYYEEYKADELRTDYGFPPVVVGNDTINETDLVRRRWLDNHFYGVVASVDFDLNESSDLTIGGGWNHYVGRHFGEVIWAEFAQGIAVDDPYYDNEANKYDANIYAKYRREFGDRVSAYADLQYRTITYDFMGPDRNGMLTDQQDQLHFFNPKAGITFQVSDELNFSLQSGIAQKEPNRDDYTESSPDSRPKAEWLWDTELGAQWKPSDNIEFRPNIYYMKYKDQLALTGRINDVGAATRVNVDHSYRLGFELEASWQPFRYLTFRGNLTLSQNRIQQLEQYVDSYDVNFDYVGQEVLNLEDTDLPFSPSNTAFVGVDFQWIQNESLSSTVYTQFKHVGKQFIDMSGDQSNILEAYQTLDIGAFVDLKTLLGKNIRLKIDVFNLLAQKYSANAWSYKYFYDGTLSYDQGFYPQALRHYNVGVIMDF